MLGAFKKLFNAFKNGMTLGWIDVNPKEYGKKLHTMIWLFFLIYQALGACGDFRKYKVGAKIGPHPQSG